MTSNRVLWTNRNPQGMHSRDKAAHSFIDTVQSSMVDFDLSEIADDFLSLPEINIFTQDLIGLSLEAKIFFDKIDLICNQNNLIGLQILTILASNMECASYTPKLKETVFLKFRNGLLLECLSRRVRIEWGLFCWKNWPVSISNFEKDNFSDLLLKLLVEESKVDPEYVFEVYCGIQERRFRDCYFFNHVKDDSEDFLTLARNICAMKPSILQEALMSYMRHKHPKFLSGADAIDAFKGVCDELFEIYNKNENLTTKEAEKILEELILYSDPMLAWYDQLHERLWSIEKEKIQRDCMSIQNYFIIFLNAKSDLIFLSEVMFSYKKWLEQYKNDEWLNVENVVLHLKHMLGFVDNSLRDQYSSIRNRYFLEPKNQQLIHETIKSYWEVIDYMGDYSTELYLYALEVAFEKQDSAVKVIRDIALESRHLFILEFEDFCIKLPEKAATLVAYMINRSMFSGVDIYIKEVLDIIYPFFWSVNISLAEQALKEGVKGEFGHMQCWKPSLDIWWRSVDK